MGDETTRCICTFDHHTAGMIACDGCRVWQHAECMNIDKKTLLEYERKDLPYLCEVVSKMSRLLNKVTF